MAENNFFASIEKTEKSKSVKNTMQAKARQLKTAYIGASIENGKKTHIVLWYAKYAKKEFLQALGITQAQAKQERIRINDAKASAMLILFTKSPKEFMENSNSIVDVKSINSKNEKLEKAQAKAQA